MLTGPEIERQVAAGRIVIDPFDPKRVNPNSVNLRLSSHLLVYDIDRCPERTERYYRDYVGVLDMALENPVVEIEIPPSGYVLKPGELYLGATMERTDSPYHVPNVEGRSSVGRLGLFVHVTAGFGDVGFNGTWTLELMTIHPIRVYAGVEICQISFTEPVGELRPYAGKYVGQGKPRPSGLWKEFVRPTEKT